MTTDLDLLLPQDQPRRRRRTVVRATLLVAVVVVLLWAVVAARLLLEARNRAIEGRDTLQALMDTDVLDADLSTVQGSLRSASDDFDAGRGNLEHPLLWPLRPLPVVGRQLASARALSVTASEVLRTLVPVVDRALAGRELGGDPSRRLELLAGLEQDLGAARDQLAAPDLGPSEALLAPLADARQEAAVQFGDAASQVDQALVLVRGLRSFLADSTYVLLASNQAEMATTGGMYLSVGELRTPGGDFELGQFGHAYTFFPVPSAGEPDPDVRARWGFMVPGNDFRKLNLTPRFEDYTGPRTLDLWQVVSGHRASGVLVLDPVVIQALLQVVGPVEVEGQTYDADTILQYALVDQYQQFGNEAAQTERREVISAVARASVQALGERSWDPVDLVRALKPAAEGRHLLAYSEVEVQEEMWSTVGVDGAIEGDELLVNVGNRAGQKLDSFLDLDVTSSIDDTPDGHRLHLDLTVTNNSPEDLGPWFDGIGTWLDVEPGTYVGRLSVFAPAGTRTIAFGPDQPFETYGPDGPLLMATTRFEVARAASRHFAIDLDLDAYVSQVTVVPSGRIPPITWSWEGRSWEDTAPSTLPVASPAPPDEGPPDAD
jgi:hypothetical protein